MDVNKGSVTKPLDNNDFKTCILLQSKLFSNSLFVIVLFFTNIKLSVWFGVGPKNYEYPRATLTNFNDGVRGGGRSERGSYFTPQNSAQN